MMLVECRLRDETRANTPRFSYPYEAMIFIAAVPIGLQIANKKQGSALNFQGLSQEGGWAKLAENRCASPFNRELSSESKT
jgi:hypothetical protein